MRIKIFVWGLLLSMGIAVGIDQSDRFQAPAASWLYPGLLENLTTVTAVRISQASEGVDLVFKNGQWSVAQRFNYPLNQKQLSKVLNQLSQARLVEKKTAMAKNHADLGLQAGLDGPAPMITLQLDQVLEPVLIGHQATARQATFVRYPTNDQVWLIDKAVEVSAAPADWLDRSLLNLTDAMIEQIDISHHREPDFQVTRAEGGDWVLASLPQGRSLRYDTVLTPFTTTVGQLRLTDVAEHDPARWLGASTVVYRLTSKHRLVLKTVSAADGYWLRIIAEADKAGEVNNALAALPSQVLSPSRAARDRFDFKIAKGNFDDLNRGLESVLKPEETE